MSQLLSLAGKLPGANLIRALPGGSKLPGMAKKGAAAPMTGTAPPAPGYPMTARLSMAYGPGARLNQKRARAAGAATPLGAITGAMNQPAQAESPLAGQGLPGAAVKPPAVQPYQEADPTNYTTQPEPWR